MTVTATPSTVLYSARKGARLFSSEDLWAIPRVGAPNLSPDGTLFAVSVTTYDLEKNEGRGRVWLVPARGGEPRPLTSPEFSSGEPVFAPDGKRLAFTRKNEKGKAQLHVMPLDGGEPRRLTDLPLGVFDPKWLPDGKDLAFAGLYWSPERDIVRQAIFVVPAAGGTPHCLTPDHPAEDRRPRYGRDGRHIVYGMTHDPFFYADRARVMAYDRQARTHSPWIEEWDRSPSSWTFGPDGTLYLEAEEAACLCLFAWRG